MARKRNLLQYDIANQSPVFSAWEKVVDKGKKQWIIYARVSTEEQKKDGNGINAQITDCKNRAKRNEVEVINIYTDEAISWTDLTRPWFNTAIKFIEQQNKKGNFIEYFICNSTSRFSRSPELWKTFDMVGRVQIAWAKLVSVGNGWVIETNTEEWLIQSTLSFMSDALESMKWSKRVKYGLKWKIYEWLRPFSQCPMWYERIVIERWGRNIKKLIRKEPHATILADGLKLFADWSLMTKHDLFLYFEEQWLRSNSKKNKQEKLHKSVVYNTILDLWKLYVYAGYLTYPPLWINELIPADHPALIDLDTLSKIMKRLSYDKETVNQETKKYDMDSQDYPLTRILQCEECWRWVTKRKSKSKTWDYHHYYGCNNPDCTLHKKSIKRDEVHNAVREKLTTLSVWDKMIKVLELVYKEELQLITKDKKVRNKSKEERIANLQKEMKALENIMEKITNDQLFQKKQEEWAKLNQEVENIHKEIDDQDFQKDEQDKVFNEAKTILCNPAAIRDFGDAELKQLVIRVCFNNKIMYKKNQGLHTPEISGIYLAKERLSYSSVRKSGDDEIRTRVQKTNL